jgi:hypothetical protein
MTVARTAITVLLVGLTGFGLWYGLSQRTTSQGTASAVAGSGATSAGMRAGPASAAQRAPHGTNSQGLAQSPAAVAGGPSAVDYRKAFRGSTNYQSFILSVLPAARSGDRDAQYYLHAALTYCDETYKFYFRPRGRLLSVDEAIEVRSDFSGPSMTEAIKRAYLRCHEINEAKNPIWGTAVEWLSKATDAGQPLAQMETARLIFLRPLAQGGIVASESQTQAIQQGTYSDARSLLRTAVETKDPEAIFNMADQLGFLKTSEPNEQLTQDAITWRYVACLRGLDCGVNAEWYLQFCLSDPNCLPDETGVDYLRRIAPVLHVIDLEERARDLNAKIDAGEWDELGLGG